MASWGFLYKDAVIMGKSPIQYIPAELAYRRGLCSLLWQSKGHQLTLLIVLEIAWISRCWLNLYLHLSNGERLGASNRVSQPPELIFLNY